MHRNRQKIHSGVPFWGIALYTRSQERTVIGIHLRFGLTDSSVWAVTHLISLIPLCTSHTFKDALIKSSGKHGVRVVFS